ncbi:uncharacterized protein AB675_3197 [Cyphellophora attinorum]|uniref:Uncharacterized protein n=1 Tax=Cyphellophora attinorum TaxID=1664694 RepID=A0A0N0NKI9_9EURO|nr:uncharacterized protein AB675_3197 [Phialophora attinorum]KPI37899.1 hypothetical protein AB675_3197 [Phialophora attinorum]
MSNTTGMHMLCPIRLPCIYNSLSTSETVQQSTITESPTNPTEAPRTSVVEITSTITSARVVPTTQVTASSSESPTPSALSAGDQSGGSGGGLGTGGTIAIAVVIPIAAIAGLLIFGFWFWRKRKARKNAEEMRKSEMAEYGFNPNNDPTLAPVGGASYAEDQSEMTEDNSGYRGWGATNSARNPSNTNGSRGPGFSDSGSQPGGQYPSPNAYSDAYSGDPMLGHGEGYDGVGALGGAAAAGAAAGVARNRSQQHGNGVHRGPSNASSAYSNRPPSEASSDTPSMPQPYYEQEQPYNDHGAYGDGTYGGGGQPVVRDVDARRNTRIAQAPSYPTGQGGISQNF